MLVNADRAVSCHKWIAPRPDSTFTFAKAGELAYGVEADSTAPRWFDLSASISLLPSYLDFIFPLAACVLNSWHHQPKF